MVLCKNCETQVEDNVNFCPSCGASMESASSERETVQVNASSVTPDALKQDSSQDAENNKGMAIVAYILFFIPLLTGAHKKSPYVKYHTNQGTVLFLFCLGWGIVYSILTAILTAILLNPSTWASGGWGAFSIITTLLWLLWLIPTVLCVLGIVNAACGRMKPLPVIGKIIIIK